MIKIFDGNAKSFNSNGKIAIKPYECKEYKKKSLNGWYIEVEVDIKYKDYILKDELCVIKSKSKINPQAFRIGQPTINSERVIFTAEHVMFDARNYILEDVRPVQKNALNALDYINERTNKSSPFSYVSDISDLNTAYFQLKTLFEAWQVIEERWKGVFDADNWNITFSNNLGKSVGELFVYKKNLKDVQIFEDWSEVVTELYPVGSDGLKLPELFLESDIKYKIPYSKTVDFPSDISRTDENGNQLEISSNELIEELRTKAETYLNKNKYPKVSYEITTDISENIDVNDKITVKHPLINLLTEVQEYVFNHNSNTTESLVFGNYTRDVAKKFNNIKETLNNLNNSVLNNSTLINEQKNIINTLNKLGQVYIDDNEILILDKLPKEEAKNVLKIGLGGISFSENGYDGDFVTAWTLDGSFNANFIKSGTINTSLIKGYGEIITKVSDTEESLENINEIILNSQGDINDLKEAMTSLKSTLLEQTNESFTMWFEQTGLKKDVEAIGDILNGNGESLNKLTEYIHFEGAEMSLGRSDSQTRLVIKNDRISFMTGDTESAYISENTLYITDSTILNKLLIGHWETKEDKYLNLNTRWVGESNENN